MRILWIRIPNTDFEQLLCHNAHIHEFYLYNVYVSAGPLPFDL
jgi:hypothetical protein